MSRLFLAVFALAVMGLSSAAQDVSIDAERLERIRKMDPAERERLLKIVRKIKASPEPEREFERLQDNLRRFRELPKEEQKKIRTRAGKLSSEERNLYRGIASQFNRAMTRGERRKMRGFPRMLFFSWLRNDRASDFDRLKGMDPEDRAEVFSALISDFSNTVEIRVRKHFKKHSCVSPEEFKRVFQEDGSMNWMMWQRFSRECRAKRGGGRGKSFPSDGRRKPPYWH